MPTYPKRLIEVDLPIKRISAHARREKSIRHGHISTLHIWWARRPLAACRAVICAALWPAPAEDDCPPAFRDAARDQMRAWTSFERRELLGTESQERFTRYYKEPALLDDDVELQSALFDFIADFSNWDNSTQPAYLETSRALTQAAHEALGGEPGTRPLVVDPFAGGGSIPLEALRVGADAFASDLNPVAVLLNKVVLEYIPRYRQRLAGEARRWGQWIKEQAEQELAPYYPKDTDGATPIAYLWARTIISEAPDDGTGIPVEVPLIRSFWLAKGSRRNVALRWKRDPKGRVLTETVWVTYADGIKRNVRRPMLELYEPKRASEVEQATVNKGAATCPVSSFVTPVESVRRQLSERHGGARDARLLAVATTLDGAVGRQYRLPSSRDNEVLARLVDPAAVGGLLVGLSEATLSNNELRRISVPIYGMKRWIDLFSPRQLIALSALSSAIANAHKQMMQSLSRDEADAVVTLLALALDKQADLGNSLCRWEPVAQCPRQLFGRQAIGMVWDFAEGVASGESSGSWSIQVERMGDLVDSLDYDYGSGQATSASATGIPLPDDIVSALVTDPPYYDAVPYAHLSDFFHIWLRHNLRDIHPSLFSQPVTPKEDEIVVDRPHELSTSTHDIGYYESALVQAFEESRRILSPNGIGVVVFASKTTASWEAILRAILDAHWTITASWPVDTEMASRLAAQGQARLGSSVHIVCRPRENTDGSVSSMSVGDWRDVLQELPQRMHDWLPRLASEGVVGADAIFACLGPALEIFSRYARVEKASGEEVTLGEYLEYVWAAVSREALAMVFEGAETSGFEEDARLTAMWLWTLTTDENGATEPSRSDEVGEGEESAPAKKGKSLGGFVLEYDAARKIAQGLGAHLEALETLVEVRGSQARLLPVAERARALLGQAAVAAPTRPRARQPSLYEEQPDAAEQGWSFGEQAVEERGRTTLDRVHQAMLLFAGGKADLLKRFLVDDGVGSEERFWRLAQALSALYPPQSDEKRWVDGVLARKKGLGFN